MVDLEVMEAAMAGEAFLLEKEEGEMKVKERRATDIDQGGMTPTEMAMVVTATTTRDKQDEDP